MTTNEARQRIEACERQIAAEYGKLTANARALGTVANPSVSNKTTMSTLLPLLLCLVGFICFKSAWFLGAMLIGFGIFVSYSLHESAKRVQTRVENGQKSLNSVIDNNSKI